MKRSLMMLLASVSLLLAAAGGDAAEPTIAGHAVKLDTQGKIIPWSAPAEKAYSEFLHRKDGHATLQLLAGTGEVSYRGTGLRGVAPLEKTLAAGALKPGIEDVKSAKKYAISTEVLKPGQPAVEHITSEPFNHYAKDKVAISGGRGAVRILDKGKVRFSIPDATYVELTCGPIGIRGMGPLDLTYAPDGWCGTVDGTRRTLVMSSPEKLLRPMLLLDGQVWASGIPDEPSPWRERQEVQYGLAAGVESGRQELQVVEWQWPPLPPVPARAALP